LCNGTVCPGMADNFNPVRQDAHLNRFADIISFVVGGVTETFLNRSIRVVEKPVGFRTVRTLYYLLRNDIVTDI
ncbi:MAG: hypothetical protein NC123_19415, partial [Butyrivibrio sp.]|nr:hypothetical protein [Butyrivibrio sp.]